MLDFTLIFPRFFLSTGQGKEGLGYGGAIRDEVLVIKYHSQELLYPLH